MTFPETIPNTLPTQDVEPDLSREHPLAREGLRVFRIGSPLGTHFEQVTCAELNCPEYLYGFITRVNSDTAIGQQQLAHIQASGLAYNSWWEEGGEVTFTFERGQNSLTPHWRRLATPPNYVVINGDESPSALPAGEWVTSIAGHLSTLRETQDLIPSEGLMVRSNKVPLIHRTDDVVGSPSIGYEITVDGIFIVNRVISANIAVPLDPTDTTRPTRLATLSDFSIVIDGIRDRGTGVVYRRLASVVDRMVLVRLQVGQWVLAMNVTFTRYVFHRITPNVVAWRLIGRLGTRVD